MAPIRKVSPSKVALTSYYGKVFISRSEYKAHDYTSWLKTTLMAMSLDSKDKRISKMQRTKGKRPDLDLPRAYLALCETVESFESNGTKFYFNYDKRGEVFSKAQVSFEGKDKVAIGLKDGEAIYMKNDNKLYDHKNNVIGSFTRYLGIEAVPPTDMINIRVYGKDIPLGLVLGNYYGISNVMKMFNVEYREMPANSRDGMGDGHNWLELVFKDKKVYINKNNQAAAMLFSGFSSMKDQLRSYSFNDFNRKSTYFPVLIDMGYSPMVINELDIMKRFFLDPMTIDALKYMKEPTKWQPLLMRVVELLTTDKSPRETSAAHQRLRGYERIPGGLYKAMVDSIRKHEMSPSRSNSRLEMKPNTLWKNLIEDGGNQLVQDINPIHILKQKEAITLAGTGGRSARTLVLRSRVFDDSYMGFISEATPDSSKVGIRRYGTPNAKIDNTLGFINSFDKNADDVTSVLSTTSLLLPASHHEDPKRANLSNSQYSSIVPTEGSMPAPYSTGYDVVIGSRVGGKYVFNALKDGVVTKVSKDFITVEYSDKTKDGYKLGTWHGEVAGSYVSHTTITDMEVGQKFKEGDVLAWNTGFFERYVLDPRYVVMKSGALAFVALVEGNDCLEDGSAISEELAKGLTTTITKRKTILLEFDKQLDLLVDIGSEVEYTDLLGIIAPYIEGMDENSDDVKANLERFKGSSPKAGFTGTVTNMELIYMGDTADMSPKLRELAERFNKAKLKESKELPGPRATDCSVSRSTFFGGERVSENTLAISIFIDAKMASGVGDKSVFANQLKSIHGRVMTGVNETESGRKLGARFGLTSVFARIVDSAMIAGGYNLAIHWGCNEFARLARGG